MAAPCGRMASRPVIQHLSSIFRTPRGNMRFRHFFTSSVCRVTVKTKNVSEEVISSPYSLSAAVCLQRLPILTADCSPIEQSFKDMMLQMELEKSLLSDHELRLLEDAERMRRKQAEEYDSDDEDSVDQDIVLTQDLEDSWEQKFRSIQPASRVRADVDKDLSSVQRCLSDSLVLLAQQKVGDQKMWLLPQTHWQEGETLRQTAERALASLPVGFKVTFLGNAPCGVYKYKLPKTLRTDTSLGTKVFFFKAILSGSCPSTAANSDVLWLKKSELQRYLKPAYMMKVERFILDL